MTKAKNGLDKNLSNVTEALAVDPVNAHHAQQITQDKSDRRYQDAVNHDSANDRFTLKDKGEQR